MKFLDDLYKICRSFFALPRHVLLLALGIGLAEAVFLFFTPVFYRDSAVYFAMVRGIAVGNHELGFALPITPLMPLLAAGLLPLGFSEQQALYLINAAFMLGVPFAVYGLFTMFLDRKQAAWGALLFFLSPKLIRYGFSPLLDSGRWLFFPLSFFLLWRLARDSRWSYAIYLGISFAGLALTRSEGIVYAGLLSALFCLLAFRQDRQVRQLSWNSFIRRSGQLAMALLILGLLCLPRLWQVGVATGYPALDIRQTWAVRGVSHQLHKLLGKDDAGQQVNDAASAATTYGKANDFDFAWLTAPAFNTRFWSNQLHGAYEPYLVLAVLGIILLWRRREWRFEHTLFLGWLFVNLVMYAAMRSAAGRYFYINALFLMPFTLVGLSAVIDWLKCRHWREFPTRFLIAPSLIATGIAQIINGVDNGFDREGNGFPEVGAELQARAAELKPRTGTPHPVYLTFGTNYGWGYFGNGNEIFYAGSNHINTLYTPEKILAEGIPSRLAYYAGDSLAAFPVLKPDVVIVSDASPELAEKVAVLPGLTLWFEKPKYRIKVYRVTTGNR